MKISFRFILLASALVLLFPLINLVVDKPVVIAPEKMQGRSPAFLKASSVIQESCLTCHSSHPQLPWYASLPIAKQIISHNIEEAREEVDLEKALFTPGKLPSPKLLKHIQSEIEEGAMPPIEYKAMHWKSFLSAKEKQAIFDWIAEQQAASV